MGIGTDVKWIDEVLDKMGFDSEEERDIARQVFSLTLMLGMLNAGGDWTKVCKTISQVHQGTGLLLQMACPGFVPEPEK
jgi:hypothetical protein